MSDSTELPRPRSAAVFDGPDRAAARAYMKGIGFDDAALKRPTIGIANTWIEAMPCNFHLRGLAEHIKEGVRAAGGTPMEFNTIAISDGITMGTKGMNVGEYDYDSIMHYDSFAFSKNGDPTIVKRSDKSLIRAQRDGLSAGDLASVEKYYGN